MAKTNKYASVNFNDIYDKKLNPSSASAATASGDGKHSFSSSTARKSYSLSASSRTSHGMLVLSRPSPKPQPQSKIQPQSPPQNPPPISLKPQTPPPVTDHQSRYESDLISLRPLGKTGPGPLLPSPPAQFPGLDRSEKEGLAMNARPKANKFVPPHLRPGFVAKEAPPACGGFRPGSSGTGSSPAPYGEYGRPKSGSGYEMEIGKKGFLDPAELNRPRSSGTYRSSSG